MLGFKNRSILIKPISDKQLLNGSSETIEDGDPFLGPQVAQAYADVAKDLVTHVALTIGSVFVVCKIVERLMR